MFFSFKIVFIDFFAQINYDKFSYKRLERSNAIRLYFSLFFRYEHGMTAYGSLRAKQKLSLLSAFIRRMTAACRQNDFKKILKI